jgi:hypothetical protein
LNPNVFTSSSTFNTAVGAGASSNHPNSGTFNTAIGADSLQNNVTGQQNTAIGFGALGTLSAGVRNVALGNAAGFNLTSGNDDIYIANQGNSTESSTIRIGSSQTATFIAGISGVNVVNGSQVVVDQSGHLGTIASSRRFKQDIQDMGDASDGLMQLRPVTFRYKPQYDGGAGTLQYGLIAEEVAKVYPGLVQFSDKGQPMTVYYHLLTSMLLNEVQKEHRQIQSQQEQIDRLTQRLSQLERQSDARVAVALPMPSDKR